VKPDNDATEFEHTLKNQMAIILGYSDLLLEDLPPGDRRVEDVMEIQKAARAAIALIDERKTS
jgi:hypothetical protein